jgi:hypothetical protein
MKKGDIMTDLKNLKDHILNDVLLLGEDDGGEKGFINRLVDLRFKQKVEELV